MTKIISFKEFINEKYEESPEFRIKSFFTELEKNIRDWFDEGTFFINGAVLGDIKRSLTHAIEKNLIFEFNDEEYYYQIYVIISIQDVTEDDLDECYIKIKKYDVDTMKLLRSLGEDVMVSDINEDKILELISKLDDESSTVDIEGGQVTLSDEESDLEDTSLV